jgi:rubrerythrin
MQGELRITTHTPKGEEMTMEKMYYPCALCGASTYIPAGTLQADERADAMCPTCYARAHAAELAESRRLADEAVDFVLSGK